MKRSDVLLRILTCLALGGMVMALWLCVLIGFGIHTTVGKEALYLCLLLQVPQLTVVALRLRREKAALGKALRQLLCLFVCLWCSGAALLLFSLGMALAGLSYGSVWVSLPCQIGMICAALGWAGQFVCLWRLFRVKGA